MIPSWLLPADPPQLAGTVREVSEAIEFRLARMESDARRMAEKANGRDEAIRRQKEGLASVHRKKWALIDAECLERGETVAQRRVRKQRESYTARKAKA